MRKPKQLEPDDPRWHSGRGGPRKGSGRPPRREGIVHHIRREPLPKQAPVHVTIQVRDEIPSLRNRAFLQEFRRSLAQASERSGFRVVHYSVQHNQVHLIVEAAQRVALGAGMKSISARLARAVHRVFARKGPVLDGRYAMRVLRTPGEMQHALAYVMRNGREY